MPANATPAVQDLSQTTDRDAAAARYSEVRRLSQELAEPLAPEDQVVQSMPDVSPTKWHLAHTAWFFETFLLEPFAEGYEVFHPGYGYLFNSYYEAVGPRHPRPERGLVTRPTTGEVRAYRDHVDEHMLRLIEKADPALWFRIASLIELGLNHEQQHQELILTDIKHVFSRNPLRPAYSPGRPFEPKAAPPLEWFDYEGGVIEIGHDGPGFAFDNEGPRHEVVLRPFRLSSRLVTNGEFLDFIEDGGYENPEHWLFDGWAMVQQRGWRAPLYWEKVDGEWRIMTLAGVYPLERGVPVCHASYFEAAAYAAWAGKRLPTEADWEVAARGLEDAGPGAGNFLDSGRLHPVPARETGTGPAQMFGDAWEWTQSAYGPYPGYRPAAGAVGEYNGKFMCNQLVLRGGSCATPPGHLRATYRNFFPPDARWQFSGFRLAEDA
ncbi:MAG: ergothioneine biosynthesis protein EgtB [Alphaproteobacteria bacterium]